MICKYIILNLSIIYFNYMEDIEMNKSYNPINNVNTNKIDSTNHVNTSDTYTELNNLFIKDYDNYDYDLERPRTSSDSDIVINNNTSSDLCLYSLFNSSKQNKIVKHETLIEFKNKLISIFFHIFLMSIFEILFYFFFIVDMEKQLLLEKITSYNDNFKEQYNDNIDPEQHYMLSEIMKEMFDDNLLNTLKTNYNNDLYQQHKLYKILIKRAFIISSFLGFIFLSILFYGRKEIKIKWVLFENIFLFLFLGLYEYIFFNMIILKYNPITDGEIQYIFVCDLISNFGIIC